MSPSSPQKGEKGGKEWELHKLGSLKAQPGSHHHFSNTEVCTHTASFFGERGSRSVGWFSLNQILGSSTCETSKRWRASLAQRTATCSDAFYAPFAPSREAPMAATMDASCESPFSLWFTFVNARRENHCWHFFCSALLVHEQ